MSSPCDASACLSRIGTGDWTDTLTWRWRDVPACCNFGHVGPSRAAALLRGRHIVFVGDSQTRRHLWALVDAVGGAARAIRRTPGKVVADSHPAFDASAIAVNDTLYDSQRAYHAGQTVLLNVDTGKWALVDPGQLCGVERKFWMTDHRLASALAKGHPPPWHMMRGAQYRLRMRVVSRTPRAHQPAATDATTALPREKTRKALEALAREAMRTWGCQAANIRDCSFNDAIQRNCARRIAVNLEHAPPGSSQADAPDEASYVFTMGEVGGSCARAANTLQRQLEAAVRDAAATHHHASTGHDAERIDADDPGRRLASLPESMQKWQALRGRMLRGRGTRGGRGLAAAGSTSGGSGVNLARALAASLPPSVRSALASVERSGPVVIDPHCVNYCRGTSHLECPKSGPTYESAVRREAIARAHALGGDTSAWNASLAVLTFVYAASLESEMSATLAQLPRSAHAYGHGADMVVVGATWASIMRTRPSVTAARASPPAVELAWDDGLTRAWSTALKLCAAAARCVLRSVPDTPRQPAIQPYRDFIAHVAPLARAAGATLLDSFSGTWEGVRAGVMAHHDSTRIHFSDTGRAYLAQLTLNAMPLVAGGGTALPSMELTGEMRLDRLVPQPAGGVAGADGGSASRSGSGADGGNRRARGRGPRPRPG